MVPFIVVWSRNTIYVYPDASGKKKDEDLELDLAGVNGLRNSDYTFTLSIMLLSTRVAVIPFAYRWRTWNLAATRFFCAHCRVVFSLCTSGPTDSHFISHSKLDMTGKWALPLGLLIEFIGRVGKKKNEDLELDLAGVNGLHNSDCTFTLSIILLSTRVAQSYCSCWWGWP